jgi:hypothetical protein
MLQTDELMQVKWARGGVGKFIHNSHGGGFGIVDIDASWWVPSSVEGPKNPG